MPQTSAKAPKVRLILCAVLFTYLPFSFLLLVGSPSDRSALLSVWPVLPGLVIAYFSPVALLSPTRLSEEYATLVFVLLTLLFLCAMIWVVVRLGRPPWQSALGVFVVSCLLAVGVYLLMRA